MVSRTGEETLEYQTVTVSTVKNLGCFEAGIEERRVEIRTLTQKNGETVKHVISELALMVFSRNYGQDGA